MIFPQEIIGIIVSFLSTRNALSLIEVSTHWRNSIFHTQHEVKVNNLSKMDSFALAMDFMNFVTVVDIEKCLSLKQVHLSFLDKMKNTLRSLTIVKHGLGSVVLKDFIHIEKIKITQSSDLHTVELSNVPKLRVLDLSKTRIINGTKILSFLTEDSVLDTVRFNGCMNLFNELQFPCTVESMRTLDLSQTRIHKGILEKCMKDCPNLTTLEINRCTALKNMIIRDHQSLERISMRFCRLLFGLRILGNTSLTRIDLSSNAVFGKFLSDILKSNPSLTHVDFSNCYHFNELCEGFEEVSLPDLVELNCDFTTLRDEHVKILMDVCTELKVLKLKQSEIRDLLDCGSSTLEVLDISGTSVTSLGVSEVIQRCPSLKELNIMTCQGLRDGQIDFGRVNGDNLEVMKIGNTVLSQKTVSDVIRNFTNLRVLDMSRIQIDEANRVLEIKDAPNLEKLNCTGNNRIEKLLIENCPLLVDLNMTECFRMVSWNFEGKIGLSNPLCDRNEKKVTVVQCREEFIQFLEREFGDVVVLGKERSYEKSTSYQQLNFLRCLERNKLKEKDINDV